MDLYEPKSWTMYSEALVLFNPTSTPLNNTGTSKPHMHFNGEDLCQMNLANKVEKYNARVTITDTTTYGT